MELFSIKGVKVYETEKTTRKEDRNMKKMIALALALLMMISVAFAEESVNTTEPMTGGWTTSADPKVTDELRALFEAGTDTLTGISYVPIAYLGSQVVAGTNHAFLCQAVSAYPGVEGMETEPDRQGGAGYPPCRSL